LGGCSFVIELEVYLGRSYDILPFVRDNYRNDRGGGRSFDRGGFGRRNFDRGGSRGGDRQMFKAVCSNCGKDCEVPFRPTNSKPVYCSDCFEKMGGGRRSDGQSDRPRFEDRRPQGGGGSDQTRAQFESLNNKLDRILQLLEPKREPVESVKSPEADKEVVEEAKEVYVKETPKAKKVSKRTTPKTKK